MLNCDEFICQLITPVAVPAYSCPFIKLVDCPFLSLVYFKDFVPLPFLIQVDLRYILFNYYISLMSVTAWLSLLLQTCQADEISLNF